MLASSHDFPCESSGTFWKILERHANRFVFPDLCFYLVDDNDSDDSVDDEDRKYLNVHLGSHLDLWDEFFLRSNKEISREEYLNEVSRPKNDSYIDYYSNLSLYSKDDMNNILYPNYLILTKDRYKEFFGNPNNNNFTYDFTKGLRLYVDNFMYRKGTLVSIFCYFYAISSEILKREHKSLNTLYNYHLIMQAFALNPVDKL